ncbi:MAG: MFS transporter, partial [Alphaproteobacteria bacterium]|nr:MFS transporter [Alphaproteobacteria bacterium]
MRRTRLERLGFGSLMAPFAVRSYRFQWPADLLTSWALEMETLILGWYVFVETDSVFLLTVFGSLQFLGTLIAPFLGLAADKVGRRTMLCVMRAFYATMALIVMTLGLSGVMNPYFAFASAALVGLVRPSDLVMRNALIGDTMPGARLSNALAVGRTTTDSARIAGALAGAGLFSVLGIGAAYIVVAAFYVASLAFTLGVSSVRPGDDDADGAAHEHRPSFWHDLKRGLVYIWQTPKLRAIMCLAFMVNLSAYPVTNGLLPYVARDIYQLDENGLGRLIACFASGALLGSILVAWTGGSRHPARFTLINVAAWYTLLFVFAHLESPWAGMPMLVMIGVAQG